MAGNKKYDGMSFEEMERQLEKSKRAMEVAEHRLNRMEQQKKLAARKDRTHRLIVNGAEFEKAFPETRGMTQEEIQEIMGEIASDPFIRKFVDSVVAKSRQKILDDLRREEG
jgi:Na+-translocating ferredoxin:NAD+ oxidoreductase RnfC subunit